MRGYRIVKNDEGYQFQLIPSNNNNQPIGYSVIYKTHEECEQGLKRFRRFVTENAIESTDSSLAVVVKGEDNYHVEYQCDGNMLLRTSSGGKSNCKNQVKKIYNFIDEYTLVKSN